MNIQEAYDLSDRQYEEVLGRTADSLGIEKIALEETTKAFLYPVAAGAASAALTYGVPAAVQAVRASRIRSNRDKYIAEMKKVHPDMKEIPKGDLHIAYNSMAIHTPEVLKDPLMGGQTLKRMARHRMADVNALNEISRLRGTNPLDQALTSATQAFATGVGTGITDIRKQQQADADFAYRKKVDDLRLQMDREKMKLEKSKFDYTQSKDTKQFDYRKGRDDKQDAYQKDRDAKADAQTEISNAFKESQEEIARIRLSTDKARTNYQKQRDIIADKRYKEEQKQRKKEERRKRRQAGATYNLAKAKLELEQAKPIFAGTRAESETTTTGGGKKGGTTVSTTKSDSFPAMFEYDPVTKKYASANLNDIVSMLRYRNR